MEFTAKELCQFLDGKLEGNPSLILKKPAKIEEGMEGDVCFLANPKYLPFAYTTKASVIIVNENQVFDQHIAATLIRVKDAYSAITLVLDQYKNVDSIKIGIDKSASVDSSASIEENVSIAPLSFIGSNAHICSGAQIYPMAFIGKNVKIGNNTIICSGAIILDNCIVGNNCIIGSSTVIGSDGFGFARQENGNYKKVAQTGNVVIEDDVEIGANTTIDRATMGSTFIRKGAKLDNLIQIAHNVEIGENTVIAAQAGISGSTKIGKNCVIGGQVGIVGHITIADGTRINAQSGVAKGIKEKNTAVTGSPAFDYVSSMRSQVVFRKLPDLQERILMLEKKLTELEKCINLKTIED